MRPRVPSPDPDKSLAESLEYALTAALVIVVVVALLEICGLHMGLRH